MTDVSILATDAAAAAGLLVMAANAVVTEALTWSDAALASAAFGSAVTAFAISV